MPKVRLFEESIYTAISTKVVGKIVHATISKGNMGMINTLFLTLWLLLPLPLALVNTCPWLLVPFFQISLKNSDSKPSTIFSGLSRALFLTFFLETAVFLRLQFINFKLKL